MTKIRKILIIRFRQIGDSILASALCSTLKKSFPEAEIHFVLNKGIAPIFENHPDIDKIITFDKAENSSNIKYIKKVWHTVNDNHYDVIIDMRSTLRTLIFSLFSLSTPFRIGRKKWYSHWLLNHEIDTYSKEISIDMVERNLLLAKPLSKISSINNNVEFRLFTRESELTAYRDYMIQMGIDFSRPVMLAGVTTKIVSKEWNMEYMKEVISFILKNYPNIQIIFNYAPGEEENKARQLFEELGRPNSVKIDLQAKSLRELMSLCSNCNLYFGNEGGTRHMAQALGVESYAIFSPKADKSMWLPKNSIKAYGISNDDLKKDVYDDNSSNSITPDIVLKELIPILNNL